MEMITDSRLLELYNSKFDYVIILNDDSIIETNEDDLIEKYEENPDLKYIFYTSDMEMMFSIKNELDRRGLL